MRKFITIVIFALISILSYSKTYTPSEECLNFIKRYEKCKLEAYADLGGGWTIGWGHHAADVYEGMTITKEEADALFKKDIQKISPCINRLLSALPYEYEFSQGFIDGMFSLIYNCGEGGVKNTPFYERLMNCRVVDGVMNEEDFKFTIAGVKISKAPTKHHQERRYEEHLMMLK